MTSHLDTSYYIVGSLVRYWQVSPECPHKVTLQECGEGELSILDLDRVQEKRGADLHPLCKHLTHTQPSDRAQLAQLTHTRENSHLRAALTTHICQSHTIT